jgi:hypothetical protein
MLRWTNARTNHARTNRYGIHAVHTLHARTCSAEGPDERSLEVTQAGLLLPVSAARGVMPPPAVGHGQYQFTGYGMPGAEAQISCSKASAADAHDAPLLLLDFCADGDDFAHGGGALSLPPPPPVAVTAAGLVGTSAAAAAAAAGGGGGGDGSAPAPTELRSLAFIQEGLPSSTSSAGLVGWGLVRESAVLTAVGSLARALHRPRSSRAPPSTHTATDTVLFCSVLF